MKGTDLTEAQIKAAAQFILERRKFPTPGEVSENQPVTITFGHLSRIVAWYGALRYKAGAEGINSLEEPGECFVVKP